MNRGTQLTQQLLLKHRQIDADHFAVGNDFLAGNEEMLDVLATRAPQKQIDRWNVGLDDVCNEPLPVENQEVGGGTGRNVSAIMLSRHRKAAVGKAKRNDCARLMRVSNPRPLCRT